MEKRVVSMLIVNVKSCLLANSIFSLGPESRNTSHAMNVKQFKKRFDLIPVKLAYEAQKWAISIDDACVATLRCKTHEKKQAYLIKRNHHSKIYHKTQQGWVNTILLIATHARVNWEVIWEAILWAGLHPAFDESFRTLSFNSIKRMTSISPSKNRDINVRLLASWKCSPRNMRRCGTPASSAWRISWIWWRTFMSVHVSIS